MIRNKLIYNLIDNKLTTLTISSYDLLHIPYILNAFKLNKSL